VPDAGVCFYFRLKANFPIYIADKKSRAGPYYALSHMFERQKEQNMPVFETTKIQRLHFLKEASSDATRPVQLSNPHVSNRNQGTA